MVTYPYMTALSAPTFISTLISIGQLEKTHDVVITKGECYLLPPSTRPTTAYVIGSRGPDKCFSIPNSPKSLKEKQEKEIKLVVQAVSSAVKYLHTQAIMNHSTD